MTRWEPTEPVGIPSSLAGHMVDPIYELEKAITLQPFKPEQIKRYTSGKRPNYNQKERSCGVTVGAGVLQAYCLYEIGDDYTMNIVRLGIDPVCKNKGLVMHLLMNKVKTDALQRADRRVQFEVDYRDSTTLELLTAEGFTLEDPGVGNKYVMSFEIAPAVVQKLTALTGMEWVGEIRNSQLLFHTRGVVKDPEGVEIALRPCCWNPPAKPDQKGHMVINAAALDFDRLDDMERPKTTWALPVVPKDAAARYRAFENIDAWVWLEGARRKKPKDKGREP